MKEYTYTATGSPVVKRDSVLVPVFRWNGQAYGEHSLERVFAMLNNPQLDKAVALHDRGMEEQVRNVLPQVKVPSGLIGVRISLTDNYYHGRLQLNHVIESLPYTVGHFRPYRSNDVIVLLDESLTMDQVINDFEDEVVVIGKTPVPSDEMIRLTRDPHAWLRPCNGDQRRSPLYNLIHN